MVAQPDFELQGDAVIDKDSLQDDVDEISFEMMGDSAQIQDAQELNEERNEKLGVVSRGITRAGPFLIKIAAVLGLILAGLLGLANAFDISFSDVRDAIVGVLNTVIDTISSIIPSTKSQVADANRFISNFNPTQPGTGILKTAGENLLSNLQQGNTELDISLLTSRDQMLGDSTQQDKSADKQNQNIFNWGS
ncbi:MAG: hypothetical protein ACNS64_01245 [Candidatus Halalkalibacterium sp. M3_1C_030]